MNSEQAKNSININEYLINIGIKPVSQNRNHLRYLSPFRKERTASFDVDHIKNTFIDWGTGQTGTIIDLVMILSNTDVSGALEILSKYRPEEPLKDIFSFSPANKTIEKEQPKNLKILTVSPVRKLFLLEYLENRQISRKTTRFYLHQITYTIGSSKPWQALGFKNDRNGYELRNKYFKGCTSKYFTTIQGRFNDQLNIFEGFMDFLSAIELGKINVPKFDCLILNSVALKEKTIELVSKYQRLNLFLDNDRAGAQTAKYFKSIHTNIIDYSNIYYPEQKDLNDFLIQVKSKK